MQRRLEKRVRFSARFLSVFARRFDVVPDVGFRRSWCPWKACTTLFLKVLDLRETELGLERYGLANRGHQSVFGLLEDVFWSGFWLDRGESWWSESYTPCLNMSYFLSTRACGSNRCESKRICARAQHPRGEKCEIFSIVLFHPSVFTCTVDVAPNVKFQRSGCRRKACATFFLKVLGSHRGELGFTRYGPANRGCRSVSHTEGSFSDRDSGFTGGALDDPRVSRRSWSYPLP